MVLGAWTRVANAGLACPDWPLCHGKLIPPLTYEIMLEYFHRLAVSLVSCSLVLVSVLVYANSERRQRFGKLLGLAWVLLFAQIIFGGLTVLKLLKGEIVATHLALGLSFFGTLLYTTLQAYRSEGRGPKIPLPRNAALAFYLRVCLCAVFFQVILGGMVSSHYAGLACPDFPTCQGLWFPGFLGNVGLHFIHRCGAVIVSLLLFRAALRLVGLGEVGAGILWGVLLLALVVLQWGLGITMIYLQIPQFMSVAHLATAILIFALLLVVHDQIQDRRLH